MKTVNQLNQLGAIITIIFYVSAILVFAFRLLDQPQVGYIIGIFELCLAIPTIYLLINGPKYNRPHLYYIQIGLLLVWMLVELLLDYMYKYDFRSVR